MSAIERVGKVVRSKTAAVGASLLVGTAIGANLPRGEHPAPEPTPTPITRVSEPPPSTQTPFETTTPAPGTPTPETLTKEFTKEQRLKDLTFTLGGFFSDSFMGKDGFTSITFFPPYANTVPYVLTYAVDFRDPQVSDWWISVKNPNKIAHFVDSQLYITSKHDKTTDDITETETILNADFDKVPELVAFISKDKHGYFTLPQDKLREFVDASGIFNKTFANNLKSFAWENFTKKNSYDEGVEDMPAVRASGKMGNIQVTLEIDSEGVVVLRTKK